MDSSKELFIVEPTAQHLDWLVGHIRPQDLLEIAAYGINLPVRQLVQASVDNCFQCLAAVNETGELMAVFGVSKQGAPWLLGTTGLRHHVSVLKGLSQRFVSQWLEHFGTLQNYVYKHNRVSARWLRGLGFTLVEDPRFDHWMHFSQTRRSD